MTAADGKLLSELIKVALGKSAGCALPDVFDWDALYALSMRQSVPSLVWDGVAKCLSANPSRGTGSTWQGKACKLKWLGTVLNMERQYDRHASAIADLAAFYRANGIRMMLLKGYGLSKYWPVPNHRPTGDIDIYLMPLDPHGGKGDHMPVWKRADTVMEEKLGIHADRSHHHHSVFTYRGTMVENHFDFVNVHSHRSNRRIEEDFKRLAPDGYEEETLGNGTAIAYPSPLLNCLFVARHNACHFASDRMSVRQLLDWALLVEKRHRDIDWERFWAMCGKMGMESFVLCMVAIAVERFSFDTAVFHIPAELSASAGEHRALADKVWGDMLRPADGKGRGEGFVYVWRRYKLWRANLWKHRMVYTDGVASTFVAQIISHLMKPSTIFGK